jgi:hypothetical protein
MTPRQYLKTNRITVTRCAADIGCSRGWLQNAVSGLGCSKRLAKAFEDYTNGAINRLQLLYPEEFFDNNPFAPINPN